MIKIKDLTVKNFMSVGNQTQAVDFDKGTLTLVLGENLDMGGDDSGARNGTGKTTIINALSYALYGQALTNIKKDNLINKINNKNMLVTLSFDKDSINYRIERGRKPNILKFYVNDEEQESDESEDNSQGDMRETQKDLDDLLGMSHEMFKHLVALNTYSEPFLSMKANDQRVIIEQLLGITLLSEKAEKLRELIKTTKDAITQESANIEATKKSNEKIQQSIDALSSKQRAWNNQHDTELEKIGRAIIELENVDIATELEAHTQLKQYLEHSARIKSLNKERATLESATAQAERSVKKYASELAALDGKKCHACEQDLHDHKHEEMSATATKHLAEAQKYADKVAADLKKITDEIGVDTELVKPNTYYDTVEEALKHQNNLNTLETQLTIKAGETDPYQEQIDELTATALQEVSWDNVNELTSVKDHQEFLLKLLTSKDSFIRKKIIDQNLAYLNNRLTYYLDKMGLPHTVSFQNDLTVEITQLGQDLDFDNLSRGERNRLILGLSWAFRDVWESLYQQINLLFIDELIDNGLDASGVENALAVLKKMGRERRKNIYLISHKDELIGRVSNVLKVIKENGFTSYANDLEITE
jgi:DNA repair exonuclease SbcCD ATPase subunit